MVDDKLVTIEFWTTGKLADAAGATSGYISQLCREGRLDAEKVGRDWMIVDESARRWLASPRKVGRPRKDEARPNGGDQLVLDLDSEG